MNDRTTIPKLSRSVTLLMVVAALSAWMGTMSSVLLVQQTRKVGELQAENRALQVSARTLKALESETMKFFDPKGFDIPAPHTEWSKITAEGRMIWDDSRWVKEAEYDKKQGKIHETVNALKAMGATKIKLLPADKIHPLSSRVRVKNFQKMEDATPRLSALGARAILMPKDGIDYRSSGMYVTTATPEETMIWDDAKGWVKIADYKKSHPGFHL